MHDRFQLFPLYMHIIHTLIAADIPGLGRVDIESLPQQALLELLVQDVHTDGLFTDANGDFTEIEKWPITPCNEHGEAIQLHWYKKFPKGGTIHLDYAPKTLISITIS